MSVGAAVALGGVIGLAPGILVSVTTDLPLAPEAGVLLGALIGWLSRRDRAWKRPVEQQAGTDLVSEQTLAGTC